MTKNIWLALVLVLLLVLGIGAVRYYKTPAVQTVETPNHELPDSPVPISQYVLGGKVTAVNGNVLTVSVSRTMVGPDGNFVDIQTKTVTVASSTQLFVGKLVNKKYTKTAAKVSDISIGNNLSMYSSENIARMDAFAPTRIDINK